MSQPTNTNILEAINGVESRLNKRIDAVESRLNKRLDKQNGLLIQIIETLNVAQNSEHQRGLSLVHRVESLEKGATA